MSLLLLIPGLVSLFLVARGRVEKAFLSVYLPCLLLLPVGYAVRLPHLPPLSTAEFALIPIGSVALSRLIRSRSFALMDLLVVLFAASVSLSEILHAPVLADAIFSAIDTFISVVLAYAAGRQLIEPDLRFATARRWVVLVLLSGPTILFEWRMGQNLYGLLGQRVLGLPNMGGGMQFRNGRARIGAVFGGGECAGIAFAMTFCLHAWLVYLRRVQARVDFGKTLAKLEQYHAPGMLLLAYAWLTQSRGPLISLAAGCLILQISRFKNTRLMTILVAALLVGGYAATSAYFASYTTVSSSTAVSEQQSSAMYRREMNKAYAPIAEAGGWTGWGLIEIPQIEGMKSLDNHYLLVHLAWGRLAYYVFMLIVWENVRVVLSRLWKFKASQDRAFAVSMLAAMAVLWLTLMTVYLGSQLPEMSFLLMGWIQSMVPENAAKLSAGQVAESRNRKFAFRRVFT